MSKITKNQGKWGIYSSEDIKLSAGLLAPFDSRALTGIMPSGLYDFPPGGVGYDFYEVGKDLQKSIRTISFGLNPKK